jgi:nicotinamidase/pyrazinamidase
MSTGRALLVVDVQPTFCEGGALAVDGGNAIAERVAEFARSHRDTYDLVVTTQDWHIDPGEHFSDTPDFVDSWPPHGVAGTPEAELHPALADLNADVAVRKGAYEAAYSGFEGTDTEGRALAEILTAAGIADVDVVGIAESHCVKETALDALDQHLRTRVFTDLTVPVSPQQGEAARAELAAAGVELLRSEELG